MNPKLYNNIDFLEYDKDRGWSALVRKNDAPAITPEGLRSYNEPDDMKNYYFLRLREDDVKANFEAGFLRTCREEKSYQPIQRVPKNQQPRRKPAKIVNILGFEVQRSLTHPDHSVKVLACYKKNPKSITVEHVSLDMDLIQNSLTSHREWLKLQSMINEVQEFSVEEIEKNFRDKNSQWLFVCGHRIPLQATQPWEADPQFKPNHHRDNCFFFVRDTSSFKHFEVDIDLSQVYAVRYFPETNSFQGNVHFPNEADREKRNKTETLTEQWMRDNFSDEFIERVKKASVKKRYGMLRVPPTSSSKSSKLPSGLYLDDYPSIVFQQTITGKNCLMLGFFNALYTSGHTSIANKMFNECSEISDEIEVLNQFRESLKKNLKCMIRKIEFLSLNDFFEQVYKSEDFWTVILGSFDGDYMHAVTVWSNMIFDSTFEKAMPFTQKALDFCVGDNCKCSGIRKGYQITLSGPTLKAHSKKLSKKRKRSQISHVQETAKIDESDESSKTEDLGVL